MKALAAFCAIAVLGSTAAAVEIMPFAEVTPGMRGYGPAPRATSSW